MNRYSQPWQNFVFRDIPVGFESRRPSYRVNFFIGHLGASRKTPKMHLGKRWAKDPISWPISANPWHWSGYERGKRKAAWTSCVVGFRVCGSNWIFMLLLVRRANQLHVYCLVRVDSCCLLNPNCQSDYCLVIWHWRKRHLLHHWLHYKPHACSSCDRCLIGEQPLLVLHEIFHAY